MIVPQNAEPTRILIIDDDENFAESLALTLCRNRSFETKIETHSSNARNTALQFLPDIILMDVLMETLSGPDLYFLFQRDATLRPIPTIVISATVSVGPGASSAVGLGLLKKVPQLSKPFQLNQLLATIDEQLTIAAKKRRPAAKRLDAIKAIA